MTAHLHSRRRVLRAGLAGLASLSLPDVLRLRATEQRRDTAVIFLLQEGGASQFETYDPKPDAPAEIRGEFRPIATKVSGIRFSELMVRQAHIADKLIVLRGIHHPSTQHSSSVHLVKTGYYCRAESEVNEMPAVGSHVARLRGGPKGLPPYAVIHSGLRYDGAHFLGKAFDPLLVQSKEGSTRPEAPACLTLLDGLDARRLHDRRKLIASLDDARRRRDRTAPEGLGPYRDRAFDMVTGPAARQAFALDREPAKLRERYGLNQVGQRMLLARRLVEAGVPFVTVGTIPWDHHGDLWKDMRRDAPAFDQGVAGLVEDLHVRGLEKRVLVIAMGEFGREPKITKINNLPPGRDHWGAAMSVLLAGGGLKGGQVIGATDSRGSRPTRAAYRAECVLALAYRHLGIDPDQTALDQANRPHALLPIHDEIRELS